MKALKWLQMRAVPQQIRVATGIALALVLVYGMNPPAAVCAAQTASPPDASAWQPGHTIVNPPVKFDHSAPLPQLFAAYHLPPPRHRHHSISAPVAKPAPAPPAVTIGPQGAAVEQLTQGTHPQANLMASFDGLGAGFKGPQGSADARNPSDNSLGVGPDEIVQIVNSRMAIFTKKGAKYAETGKALFGPVVTNTLFAGFGGPCEKQISGDAVVRYDQLANRWLFVLPIFRRPADQPKAPYGICYAVSASPDPMGAYYRYEFSRPLFPDYPRPAIWPNGYYLTTSTGDTVIQKHVCAADRSRMLRGLAANEQCEVIDGVSFLNPADLDGRRLPPAGMPEIVMAAGGTQLHQVFEDDGIYVWKFQVNWKDPGQTRLTGPQKVSVAPYHFLCNGQLSKCVPQPGTDVRLDAQGDKLMQRLVYRNLGHYQSIVASQSIDTKAGGGGVRWYEFRLDPAGNPQLFQQGTYAPGGSYRWHPSIAMDRKGDIGVGYSFGDKSNYPGQRFVARRAGDPKGQMTLRESVLAAGIASQTNTMRWEDYTTLDIDPSDDCTFWYVGDYFKKGQPYYSTRIGAYSLPGCAARHKVLGLF
ncbi:MAG: hypothetical protein WBD10_11430 [Acidobacteriaceae bacterium]